MFRKRPQCVESVTGACVLVPAARLRARCDSRALQRSSSGFAIERSIGSTSQAVINWDAAGTETWDGGEHSQAGPSYSTDPFQ